MVDGRAETGRFAAGWQGGGRKPGQTITAELRRQADPERIAAYLLSVIEDPKASTKDRLRAAELVQDRLEGRSVALNVSATVGQAPTLPSDWTTMSLDERRQFLDAIESTALAVRK